MYNSAFEIRVGNCNILDHFVQGKWGSMGSGIKSLVPFSKICLYCTLKLGQPDTFFTVYTISYFNSPSRLRRDGYFHFSTIPLNANSTHLIFI